MQRLSGVGQRQSPQYDAYHAPADGGRYGSTRGPPTGGLVCIPGMGMCSRSPTKQGTGRKPCNPSLGQLTRTSGLGRHEYDPPGLQGGDYTRLLQSLVESKRGTFGN
jgi:hypothetical protein